MLVRVALLLGVLVLAGCAQTTPAPEPVQDTAAAVRLVQSIQVDTRWSGEPSILAMPDGTLLITGAGGMTRYAENPADAPGNAGQSYLWRSTDNGTTWQFIDLGVHAMAPYRSGVFGVEGDLAQAGGAAYFVDLTMLATQGTAVSLDGGATWLNAGAPVTGVLPGTDRPWIAAGTKDATTTVAVKYLHLSGHHRVAYMQALQAAPGALFPIADYPIPSCGQTPITVAGNGSEAQIVMACVDGGALSTLRMPLHVSTGIGLTPERMKGPEGRAAGGISAVLAAGQGAFEDAFVMAWNDVTDGSNIHVALSLDEGATWSQPMRVNAPNSTAVFPWVDINAAGQVAVTWYETAGAGEPQTIDGAWMPKHAALDVTPGGLRKVATTELSDHAVHNGPICMQGLFCVTDGRAKERRLLDFFEVDLDESGTSHVTWTDNSGDVPTIWYGQVRRGTTDA
jgi:hypothetical protein